MHFELGTYYFEPIVPIYSAFSLYPSSFLPPATGYWLLATLFSPVPRALPRAILFPPFRLLPSLLSSRSPLLNILFLHLATDYRLPATLFSPFIPSSSFFPWLLATGYYIFSPFYYMYFGCKIHYLFTRSPLENLPKSRNFFTICLLLLIHIGIVFIVVLFQSLIPPKKL